MTEKKKITLAGATRGVVPPLKGETTTPRPTTQKAAPGNVDDLLAQASQLSVADRKALLAHLALTEQGESGEVRDVDMWSAAVHEALEAHAGAGHGSVPGPGVIRGLVGASKAWAPVRDFMLSSKLQELKVTERRSVYGLLARLVVQDAVAFCKWSRAPLGPKVVAQRCEHISGTFDQSFPGYLASGLGPMVARALVAGGAPR